MVKIYFVKFVTKFVTIGTNIKHFTGDNTRGAPR